MKRIELFLLGTLLLGISFSSCHQANVESSYDASTTESTTDYSSEEANYDRDNRKIIKTAMVDLKVDKLEKTVLDLKTFLKPIKGYVHKYEISNERYEVDNYQKSIDSNMLIEQIHPHGNLSVRVPIIFADSFINYILQNNSSIMSLKINDDDVTENLWQKKQIAKVYSNSGKAQQRKKTSTNITYDNSTSINAIKAKALAAKMDYQTKYLWFDISMKAKPIYVSTTTIASKHYRTPIHIGLVNAMVKGWYICADIILALVTIWPILLLITLGLFTLRKYKVRMH